MCDPELPQPDIATDNVPPDMPILAAGGNQHDLMWQTIHSMQGSIAALVELNNKPKTKRSRSPSDSAIDFSPGRRHTATPSLSSDDTKTKSKGISVKSSRKAFSHKRAKEGEGSTSTMHLRSASHHKHLRSASHHKHLRSAKIPHLSSANTKHLRSAPKIEHLRSAHRRDYPPSADSQIGASPRNLRRVQTVSDLSRSDLHATNQLSPGHRTLNINLKKRTHQRTLSNFDSEGVGSEWEHVTLNTLYDQVSLHPSDDGQFSADNVTASVHPGASAVVPPAAPNTQNPYVDPEGDHCVANEDDTEIQGQTLTTGRYAGLTLPYPVDVPGPPVNVEFADLVKTTWSKPYNHHQMTPLHEKYQLPGNLCDSIYTPTMNPEIFRKLAVPQVKGDIKFQGMQKSLTKILSSTLQLNSMLEYSDVDASTKERANQLVIDNTAMLSQVHKEISLQRRSFVQRVLNPQYKHLCSKSHEITKQLFGDTLTQDIKDLNMSNNLTRNVSYVDRGRDRGLSFPRYHSHTSTRNSFLYQGRGGRGQYPQRARAALRWKKYNKTR